MYIVLVNELNKTTNANMVLFLIYHVISVSTIQYKIFPGIFDKCLTCICAYVLECIEC